MCQGAKWNLDNITEEDWEARMDDFANEPSPEKANKLLDDLAAARDKIRPSTAAPQNS